MAPDLHLEKLLILSDSIAELKFYFDTSNTSVLNLTFGYYLPLPGNPIPFNGER